MTGSSTAASTAGEMSLSSTTDSTTSGPSTPTAGPSSSTPSLIAGPSSSTLSSIAGPSSWFSPTLNRSFPRLSDHPNTPPKNRPRPSSPVLRSPFTSPTTQPLPSSDQPELLPSDQHPPPSSDRHPLHFGASSSSRHDHSDPPPPQPPPKDAEASPLQSVRLKMSSHDAEAMRKLRSTMAELSAGSGSKPLSSPLSPTFSHNIQAGPSEELRSRQMTLAMPISQRTDDPDRTPRPNEVGRPPESNADFVIAVIGHQGVGKSTIIRRATKPWGSSSPLTANIHDGHQISSCFSRVPPGGKLRYERKVEFVEIPLSALNLSGSGTLFSQDMPNISGVLLCYDATRTSTLQGIPEALSELSILGTSTVLLACKSDPNAVLQVQPAQGNALGEPYNIGLIEVTITTPEGKSKMRNGLRWLLYKLEQRHHRRERKASNDSTGESSRTPLNLSRPFDNLISPESDASSGTDRIMWHRQGKRLSATGGDGHVSDTRSSSSSLQWIMNGPPNGPHSGGKRDSVGKSSLGGKEQVDQPLEPTAEQISEKQPLAGYAFEPPLYASLEDLDESAFHSDYETFVRAFFMTYRRFCHPYELMAEFLERFREIERYTISSDTRRWALLRLNGALLDWTTRYPGDLASEQTRATLRDILELLLKYTFMAHLTADLVSVEQSTHGIVDIDASWSLRLGRSAASVASTSTEIDVDKELLYDLDSLDTGDKDKAPSGHSVSTTSLQAPEPGMQLNRNKSRSFTKLVRAGSDDSGMSASRFGLGGNDDVGFPRWTAAWTYVVQQDANDFAMELTRMQWELFSAIRPRDVFRHDFGKEQDDPVGKSILFFNHISRWVTTMILSHPKAKHRARIYERFMLISHQLRRLNNYDGLYAVISGMSETSVHRLHQTHQLVQAAAGLQNDFQSHIKLMDTRGGYMYYRRVLAADMLHGRPAIPLLTTILSLVNRLQGARSEDRRADGMIQWDKFARFADMVSVITECQSKGSMVRGQVSMAFKSFIEDTPIIINEDGLYERSQMLEPPAGGSTAGNILRRLGNLGR
ncbi:ras guanine nucleotide exchange factor domain-containing protein [Naematelia encephala]|uniref:Ras guanine nucleotide exchange factor domain-containing protein n=1 Tax=Naematelia encephala TaxID=71784 RepID=A0A1Y2BJ04_9TREE|nr:ras guanine nucleotide exchange factor domain-containing protein [Naematelia encephala]